MARILIAHNDQGALDEIGKGLEGGANEVIKVLLNGPQSYVNLADAIRGHHYGVFDHAILPLHVGNATNEAHLRDVAYWLPIHGTKAHMLTWESGMPTFWPKETDFVQCSHETEGLAGAVRRIKEAMAQQAHA